MISTNQITKEEIGESAFEEAQRMGCDDISVQCSNSTDRQVRFANNSITLVNKVRNLALELYVTKEKRRVIGSSYNITADGIKKFVKGLVESLKFSPPSEDYVSLPKTSSNYSTHANYDPAAQDAPLTDFVKEAIEAGLSEGAERVSGSLNSNVTELFISTSGGCKATDVQSQLLLNVRAFAAASASGHGLSCSSYVSDFKPAEAGQLAGQYAKKSENPKTVAEGKYDVIFMPTVIANILPIASSASAFAIDTGQSFLAGKLGQKIGVDKLNVQDWGVYEGGLGGRIFDDEGVPTGQNDIVVQGEFQTILHNSSSAKKLGNGKSTGNAGIIAPRPNTIVFGSGDSSVEEMIRDTSHGLLITNNWYTRYQNARTGEYSTMPRDAALIIEHGELKGPAAGFRISDSIPRQLSAIGMIGRERQWIRWWEVSIPTLAPAMLIRDVQITRAVGS